MTLNEKVAYIKGLMEGMKLDKENDTVKVLNAVVDVLDDLALSQTNLEDLYDELSWKVDEIDEDLGEAEEFIYGDDDFCCCDDDDDCCEDEDIPFYEVTCGNCGKTICVSEDVLLEGEIECPNCGEILEFDFSDLFDDDEDGECSCGCCDCSDNSDEDLMS